MARLVPYPIGLRPNRMRKLSGPKTRNAGQSVGLTGYEQTVASPFGARRIELSFPPLRGQMARRARGWITAMHGGANATRIRMCDWDGMTLAQRGITATSAQYAAGSPWSNGLPWSNGENWHNGNPSIAVTAAAAEDDTIVSLSSDFWGANLGVGDWIGFFPFHLAAYEVTEVLPSNQFRLDLPLRAALTTSSYAYLNPVLAMRMESENSADAERDASHLVGLTVTLVEVFDFDVREYFTG